MQKPFSKYQLGLLGASIPTADTRQPLSSLTLPYVELFLCSTWFPRGTRAAGMLEAGELLLMQGTESLGQQHEGSAWGGEMDLQKDWHGPARLGKERRGAMCHGAPLISALIPYVTVRFGGCGAFKKRSSVHLQGGCSFPVWSAQLYSCLPHFTFSCSIHVFFI